MSKTPSRAAVVVGLDVHPDTFAAAILCGRDPATAKVKHTSTRVPLDQLEAWTLRHTQESDTLVLEASANSFAVAARLHASGRTALILDSHQAGKVGKVYCANDKVDAVKIARIHLSGLATKVWQPDAKTLERREVFGAYQSVVKETTRHQQQIRALLNEHCLRLPAGFRLAHPASIPACSHSGRGPLPKPCSWSRCTRRWWRHALGARACAATWQERSWAMRLCCGSPGCAASGR